MPVTITTQPESQRSLVGGSVTFSVAASGSSPFTYQWKKDGVDFGPDASSVSLTNITSADAASYTVVVTGSDSFDDTSDVAILEVSNEKSLIPLLTSNSSNPSGHVVTTSAETVGSGEAYRALDGTVAALLAGYSLSPKDSWQTPAGLTQGWIQVQFPTPTLLRRYRVYPPANTSSAPRDWIFQGSFDGMGWVLLDLQSFVSGWTPGTFKEFVFPNTNSYTYYKFAVTQNQTTVGNVAVSELLVYNDPLLAVEITSPTPGTRVANNTTVTLTSTPTVSAGRSVQKVQFYADNEFIDEVSSLPYEISWAVSTAGSYQITAVVVDDLDEQVVSDRVMVVVDSEILYSPPVVHVITPFDGANFKTLTAIVVPVVYDVVSLGSTITSVEIIVDSVTIATLTASRGTYFWRPTAGTYDLQIAATDANASTTTTDAMSIVVVGDNTEPSYGQTGRLTADFGIESAPSPAIYTWKLWDKTTRVTLDSTTQKIMNRSDAAFSVEVNDQYGQSTIQISSAIPVDMPPQISSTRTNQSQQILPYYATITARVLGGGPVPVFVWRDSDYRILAISDPNTDLSSHTYTHKVTSVDEKIYLTVGANINWNSQFTVDFTLPGKVNTAPTLSAITTGLRPKAWKQVLSPVLAATTVPLNRLIGEPTIDDVDVPPQWTKNGSVFAETGAARILVRNQFTASQNGVYLATTSRLRMEYQGDGTSITPGVARYDTPSTTLRVSHTDQAGDEISDVLTSLLVPGRKVLISDISTPDTVFIELQIASVTAVMGGFVVLVVPTDLTGTAPTPGTPVYLDFGWTRAEDEVDFGNTVQVKLGTENGGDYFAFVGDPAPDLLIESSTIQAVKANVIYDGSTQPKSRMYIEVATVDKDGLNCDADLIMPNASSHNTLDGAAENLIRSKVITDGIGIGIYPATVEITDSSPISGFAPITSTAKAIIPITDSLFLPPRPTSTPQTPTSGSSASSSPTTVPPPVAPTVPNPITVVGPTSIGPGQTLSFAGVGASNSGIGQRINITITIPVLPHTIPTSLQVFAGDGVTLLATVQPGAPFNVNSNLPYVLKNQQSFTKPVSIVEVFNPA